MNNNLPKIIVVCFANYCRSPVAEVIIQEKYKNKAIVSSAGLKPLPTSEMDKRSRKYLETIGIQPALHMPRKFESFNAKEANLILALDMLILSELNRKFPNYRQKIKLLNFKKPLERLNDPFQFDEERYFEMMNKIKRVIEETDYL